jgi:hypothetical protein
MTRPCFWTRCVMTLCVGLAVPAWADDALQKSCDDGDANACNRLGIAYTEGEVAVRLQAPMG